MLEVKEHIATKKLVPQLGFKEFDGAWEKHSLKYLLGSLVDCEHKTAPYVEESEYLVVRTNNVKGGQLVYEDIKYTTEEGFKEWTKRTVPKFGDILFTREAPAGESCLVPEDKKVCLGQRMVLLKSDENKMTGQYLSSYLQSGSAIRDISNLSIGTTVTRINIADIYKLKCPVSTIPEQQKIASFLSAVDEKIQQLTKKMALLEQYKKGVMQQLFSGQLLFKDENGNPYPDWEEKKISDVCERSTGRSKSNEIVVDGRNIIVDMGAISRVGKLLGTKRTNCEEDYLDTNDLVMAKDDIGGGQIIGKVVLIPIEDKYILGDHVYKLKVIKGDVNYLYYSINSYAVNKSFRQKANGTAQIGINNKTVDDQLIPFHCIEAQQKIATYLSGIDTKIESINNQITQTQTFKKGLLQQMFV